MSSADTTTDILSGAAAVPSPEALRRILGEADFLPLALAVVQARGDRELLARLQAARSESGQRPSAWAARLGDEVRARAEALLVKGTAAVPAADDPALMAELAALIGDGVDGAEYLPMLMEQAGWDGAAAPVAARGVATSTGHVDVAVIGAGMSGLCAAIRLAEAGLAFRVFERGTSVGGTWHENVYPGCGVDTPSLFYSYSFETGYRWRHHFAKRDQIADYFERCVDKYRLHEAIELGSEVTEARFDEARRLWVLTVRSATGQRTVTAVSVITAVGQLNIPAVPRIAGLDTFGGVVAHTARWPQGLDVRGRRVGMIGTGASGMQVGPAIAADVAGLTIFQRSPHWVLANPVYHAEIDDGQHWLMATLPHYAQWQRALLIWSYGDAVYPALQKDPAWPGEGGSINAVSERFRQNMLRHLQRELEDRPDLLAKATPDYPPYGKRVLLDNHWFRMLKRPNVELVTEGIERVTPDGVATADGRVHALDVLVLATGFQATRMLSSVDFRGRGGVRLRELWDGDNPSAYLGITVPRFPNLYVLYGPNTNLGYGGSAIFNAECQVRYALACIREMRRQGWRSLECRPEVHDAYNATVDTMHDRMVWSLADVDNWYRNARGRVATNSPWRLLDYWRMTRTPDFGDFLIEPAGARQDAAAAEAGSR